jgi:hypothetical protein
MQKNLFLLSRNQIPQHNREKQWFQHNRSTRTTFSSVGIIGLKTEDLLSMEQGMTLDGMRTVLELLMKRIRSNGFSMIFRISVLYCTTYSTVDGLLYSLKIKISHPLGKGLNC